MEPTPGRTTGAGVLAAALPVLAVPAGVVLVSVRLSEEGRLDRTLLVDWQDHPVALSAVGVLGGALALIAAVSLYLLVQRGSLAALGLPAACSLLVVVGAVLRARLPGSTLAALPPTGADALLPLLGGLWREGAHLLAVARTLAASVLGASALGCGVIAAARPERLPRLLALLLALHAVLLGALGVREEALAAALDAGVHEPREQMLAVAVGRSALAPDVSPVLIAVVVALGACLVVGARTLRASVPVAALFVLMGLTGFAGPGAHVVSQALVRRALEPALPPPAVPLLPLEGALADPPLVVLDAGGLLEPGRDAPVDDARLRALVADVQATRPHLLARFPIGVREGARGAELQAVGAVLAQTTPAGAVVLVGLHHEDVSRGARELRWLFEALQDGYRGETFALGASPGDGVVIVEPARLTSVEALLSIAREARAEGKVVSLSLGP